jgi:hypothetical protein
MRAVLGGMVWSNSGDNSRSLSAQMIGDSLQDGIGIHDAKVLQDLHH